MPVNLPANPVVPATDMTPAVDGGFPIPSDIDFSAGGSTWCPATITNCGSCGEFLPSGQSEGTCVSLATILLGPIDGVGSYNAGLQCRCYTQDNPDPVWDCRYIGGNLGTVVVPVSPICAPASQPGTNLDDSPDVVGDIGFDAGPPTATMPVVEEEDPVPVVLPETTPSNNNPISNNTPSFITEIAVTTVCLPRLPTSGLTKCNLAPGAICCHGVQISAATVCKCLNGLFQCDPGIPSQCPDDQNPNVIQPIRRA